MKANEVANLYAESNIMLVCKCGDISHQLVFRIGEEKGEVLVSIHLTRLPFWKRLVVGLRYIFGRMSIYGDFEEVILDKSHLNELKKIERLLSE